MKRTQRPRPTVRKSKTNPNNQYAMTGTGHYYQPARKPNIVKLNAKGLKAPGLGNQPKFQERDLLISKKTLQHLDNVQTFDALQDLDKFKTSLKKIHFVKIRDGIILYMFEGADKFIEEKSLELNYVHHFKETAWIYYLEKNKNRILEDLEENSDPTIEMKAEKK